MMHRITLRRATNGSFRWSGFAIVPEVVNGRETQATIRTGDFMTKWGARRELRRRIRQHYASNRQILEETQMIKIGPF